MKYRIFGADAETGADVELALDAEDEKAAAASARRRGVLVTKCVKEASEAPKPNEKYRILGADAETGEDVELVLEAATADAAISMARRRNVLVAECLKHPALPANVQSSFAKIAQQVRFTLFADRDWQGAPKPTSRPPTGFKARTQRIVRVIGIALLAFFALGVFAGIAALITGSEQKAAPSPAKPPADPNLPAIHIDNQYSNIAFSNWHIDGFYLVATAIWNGDPKPDGVFYTIRKNGVVKDRGSVTLPGSVLVKNEAVEARIHCGDDAASLDVTVEVK